MKKNIKSFYKVALSNALVMLLGVVSTLIIPTVLGPSEFGQWQVYVLYSSYVGLLLFGFCDGLYLIHGGESYKKLDYGKFSSYFYLLTIYLLIISLISYFSLRIIDINNDRKFTLIAVCITILLQGLNSYFILINQATSRFTIYSVTNSLEKVVFVLSTLILLLVTESSFIFIILIALFAKMLVLLVNILADKDLVFTKPKLNIQIFREITLIIRAGLPLTLSGIFSMLITGSGRFLVEFKLGLVQFGYYSLAFSIISIVTQVIVAGSVVLYPIMRNTLVKNYYAIIKNTDKLLEYVGVLINLLYFPVVMIINFFLPEYKPALVCILVIFPILIYQSRMSIVYNTFYKVLRLENKMLFNGLVALLFCLFITHLLFLIKPSIFIISIATLISYIFWNFISGYYLYRKLNKSKPFSGIDITSTTIFIILNMYFPSITSLIFYLIFILILFISKKGEIINLIRYFKKAYSN
jgi:O-antigen/teichoic acid export membrane protein